jgi:hypothetical protein
VSQNQPFFALENGPEGLPRCIPESKMVWRRCCGICQSGKWCGECVPGIFQTGKWSGGAAAAFFRVENSVARPAKHLPESKMARRREPVLSYSVETKLHTIPQSDREENPPDLKSLAASLNQLAALVLNLSASFGIAPGRDDFLASAGRVSDEPWNSSRRRVSNGNWWRSHHGVIVVFIAASRRERARRAEFPL